jgi:hypothetical protein
MLNIYQDINEDEFMVSEKILVATTLFNTLCLNTLCTIKLSGARASIIAALDMLKVALHHLVLMYKVASARRRRSGGGPGGGCARKPVGIPSPPRGGR